MQVAHLDIERIKRSFNTGEFRTTKREPNIPKGDTAENTTIDPLVGGWSLERCSLARYTVDLSQGMDMVSV